MTNFTQPVVTSAINAADNLVGFQGDFTFDETVVTFQSPPVSAAGLTNTTGGWSVLGNVLAGPGPIRTLRSLGHRERYRHGAVRVGDSVQSEHDQGEQHAGCEHGADLGRAPDNLMFFDVNGDPHAPGSTPPGSITIQAAATINISGTVIYCSNPALNPVPGVTMTLTGDMSGSTLTDGSG